MLMEWHILYAKVGMYISSLFKCGIMLTECHILYAKVGMYISSLFKCDIMLMECYDKASSFFFFIFVWVNMI